MKKCRYLLFIIMSMALTLKASVKAEESPDRLVNLALLPNPPLQEIKYATKYNFTQAQLYPFPAAYLNEDAAKALEKVQMYLAKKGLGLKIWDAYRPLSVQQKMWDLIHDDRYVSDPRKNQGRHTRGTAVDVTLVDKWGHELSMPTDFDNFTERAYSHSPHLTSLQKHNRALLQEAMVRFGFKIYPYELWHFDFQDGEKYPPMNFSFKEIAKRSGGN